MVVEEFPMTVTGKIRKVQMREESAARLGLQGGRAVGQAGSQAGGQAPVNG